ncbi:MAG: hypothetical protein ACP5QK_11165 [Myxococcota bacterium]
MSLRMEGNNWKTENIENIRLNRGSVLRVAIKVPLKGELQGIEIDSLIVNFYAKCTEDFYGFWFWLCRSR